ncbi:uncharacterized protein EAF02_001611 [Botrytis sinoallii]|uniref:uncharacterized protein n=1 Tax=Botrytis sinoallii TaxID=1463999 RepID=UPI0019018CD2|nr:uncharacterized protein EAF02_001611 [Botrytis sinoallii]KAF7891286.1 hypothetical protein EAF02_001611 [Botrytis sinoallii]
MAFGRRRTIDDYFMYEFPPDDHLFQRNAYAQRAAASSSLSAPNSSSGRIVPIFPNEIVELCKQDKAVDFEASVFKMTLQDKINESQGPEVGQSNEVAASKLPDWERKSLEEETMRRYVLKEKMALEREITELRKRNEELENQVSIMDDEKLEKRLRWVAREEETVDQDTKKSIQRILKASLKMRELREKGALQEAESAYLLRREEEMRKREREMREREEQFFQEEKHALEKEEQMFRREEQVLEKEEQMFRREEQVLEKEGEMVRAQRQLHKKATSLAAREQFINRFSSENRSQAEGEGSGTRYRL